MKKLPLRDAAEILSLERTEVAASPLETLEGLQSDTSCCEISWLLRKFVAYILGRDIYCTGVPVTAKSETHGLNKGPITWPLLFATLLTCVNYWLHFHEIIIRRLFFGNGVLEELYPQLQSCPVRLKNKGLEVWSTAKMNLCATSMFTTMQEAD